MDAVDFKHLELPNSPNYYWVCPVTYCNKAPSEHAPVFDVGKSKLQKIGDKILKAMPRMQLIKADTAESKFFYVQKSLVFRFPDYITIQYIDVSPQQSSVALLSRSKYGYYDFSVNKKRVQSILRQLQKGVDAASQ